MKISGCMLQCVCMNTLAGVWYPELLINWLFTVLAGVKFHLVGQMALQNPGCTRQVSRERMWKRAKLRHYSSHYSNDFSSPRRWHLQLKKSVMQKINSAKKRCQNTVVKFGWWKNGGIPILCSAVFYCVLMILRCFGLFCALGVTLLGWNVITVCLSATVYRQQLQRIILMSLHA